MCISILHNPGEDPMMYESSSERWSPVQSVEKILMSVVSMLSGTAIRSLCLMLITLEPNVESSADIDTGKLFREDNVRFNQLAREASDKSFQQAVSHPLHLKLKKHGDVF